MPFLLPHQFSIAFRSSFERITSPFLGFQHTFEKVVLFLFLHFLFPQKLCRRCRVLYAKTLKVFCLLGEDNFQMIVMAQCNESVQLYCGLYFCRYLSLSHYSIYFRYLATKNAIKSYTFPQDSVTLKIKLSYFINFCSYHLITSNQIDNLMFSVQFYSTSNF